MITPVKEGTERGNGERLAVENISKRFTNAVVEGVPSSCRIVSGLLDVVNILVFQLLSILLLTGL